MNNLSEKKIRTVKNSDPTWTFKPVIYINNNTKYSSLSEAAQQVYHNKRRYGEISEVCKNLKRDYKGDIWRFEEDYLLLSDEEKKALKDKCIRLNKPYIKYRTKLFFKGQIYDSFSILGKELLKENFLSYRKNTHKDLSKLLSTLVGISKKKCCPFVMLKNEYVFWADYEVLCKDERGAFKINESPVNKDIKETYEYYIKYLDTVIGDITISELLQSGKDTFYKLDDMYFKSQSNIKNYAYDNTIDKATLVSLINNPNYKFLFNKDSYILDNTTKNKFYIKNNYIFLNKDDYISRFIKLLTKNDVLKELNLV